MDKKTEALKLALDLALDVRANAIARLAAKAIALMGVIDSALAEQPAQQQEPEHYCVDAVAWETFIHDYDRYISGNPNYPWQNIREGLAAVIESATPASKPWVGLTEKEVYDLADADPHGGALRLYRAIEAKLREKNA